MPEPRSESPLDVVGGVYGERCLRPAWSEVFGSGGRAASAIATMNVPVVLHTYLDATAEDVISTRSALEGFEVKNRERSGPIHFLYTHGLDTPRIVRTDASEDSFDVSGSGVLRFGFIEGDAVVHGSRVVYDPQDPREPRLFQENGSTAGELALVLNRFEAERLSKARGAPPEELAKRLVGEGKANVVVIKRGPKGALVWDGHQATEVPAFRSQNVWKIGSGDVFAAHFALHWIHARKAPRECARLASLATAFYCRTRGFPGPDDIGAGLPDPIPTGGIYFPGTSRPSVYLAGPFFTLAELWLVEEAKTALISMGMQVFSPYHDVGLGSAEDVVQRDLQGIEDSDVLFAICDGWDPGTLFEIGYASALGKKVVVYCESEAQEKLKMMQGSGAVISDDFVSAIYQSVWAAYGAS